MPKTKEYAFTVRSKDENRVDPTQNDATTFHIKTIDGNPVLSERVAAIYDYDGDQPAIEFFGLLSEAELVSIIESISKFMDIYRKKEYIDD